MLKLGERLGSGDGERKTLLTRQIAFEPLPASVLFALDCVTLRIESRRLKHRLKVGQMTPSNEEVPNRHIIEVETNIDVRFVGHENVLLHRCN